MVCAGLRGWTRSDYAYIHMGPFCTCVNGNSLVVALVHHGSRDQPFFGDDHDYD